VRILSVISKSFSKFWLLTILQLISFFSKLTIVTSLFMIHFNVWASGNSGAGVFVDKKPYTFLYLEGSSVVLDGVSPLLFLPEENAMAWAMKCTISCNGDFSF
jgi:hypothetical protein